MGKLRLIAQCIRNESLGAHNGLEYCLGSEEQRRELISGMCRTAECGASIRLGPLYQQVRLLNQPRMRLRILS